jgi:hypothetical protein
MQELAGGFSSALSVLPVGGDVGASLIEMHVLIDVVDPGERNEVMMLTVRRTLLRQLDLVRTVQMIDFSDHLSIGRNHVHVFLDFQNVCHGYLPFSNRMFGRLVKLSLLPTLGT